ncbi:morphogenic membrane protein MmpB [Kitasatospora gansuensis]
MLWSDPRDETSAEARRVQRMLRRAGPVLAAIALVMAVLLML